MAKKPRDYKAEYKKRVEKGLSEGKTKREAGGHWNIKPVKNEDNPVYPQVGQTVGRVKEFSIDNYEKQRSISIASMVKMLQSQKPGPVRIAAYGLYYTDPSKTSRWIGNVIDRNAAINTLQQMIADKSSTESAVDVLFNLVEKSTVKVTEFSVLNPGKER